MLAAIIVTLYYALNILWWLVIASAVLSWLLAFNIVNPRNQFVGTIGEFLYRLTEPIYRPIRRILPNLGGIDLSPLVVLLAIIFLQTLLVSIAAGSPGFGTRGF